MVKQREIEETEARTRSLLAEIIPLIGKLPDAALADVNSFLDNALDVAKKNIQETQKVKKAGDSAT